MSVPGVQTVLYVMAKHPQPWTKFGQLIDTKARDKKSLYVWAYVNIFF